MAAEIPRFTTHVLGSRTEDGAFDRHAPVGVVVVSRRQQPLDRQAEQDDPPLLLIEVPSGHLVCRLERRHCPDLEAHVLQLGPRASKELHGGSDGEIESVDATVEGCQRRTNDLAAPQSTVPSVTRAAARGCRGAGTTGHSESLGRLGAASAARPPGLVLERP